MSRRTKRPLSRQGASGDDRPKRAQAERKFRQGERPTGHRPGGKPARFAENRQDRPLDKRSQRPAMVEDAAKAKLEAAKSERLPTKVQTVVVTPDEDNMRV